MQVNSIGSALLVLQHQWVSPCSKPVLEDLYPKAHDPVYSQHEISRVPFNYLDSRCPSRQRHAFPLPAAERNVHSAALAVPPLLIASMVLSADGDRSWGELGHIVEILSPSGSEASISNGQEIVQPVIKSNSHNNSEEAGRAYSELQHVCIGRIYAANKASWQVFCTSPPHVRWTEHPLQALCRNEK